ncbi:MAG: glycine--tRNA ligase subunit beta [Anaerolineales bacterium]|nr:glycine--tRNA ligase subunit beta [Anaerolineales bacterium]
MPQSTVNYPSSFLLEIGTEELPAGDVDAALAQLRERVPAWLQELRLEHGTVSVHATPRRLTVFVENLAPAQADREELVKGPPAEKAFDPAGNPTPAALGFARKNGLQVADLQVRDMDGGKYVVAVVKSKGRPALEILAEALPGWVAGIAFVKTMRWNQSGVAFSRPIRWFVALLGEQVIPFAYAGVSSGRISRGLRPCDSPEIIISSAETYFQAIRQAGILLDLEERKAAIVEQVNAAAQSVGGQALIEPGLLAEVANLIEKPTAVLGAFDAEFLALPRDVLIGTMKKHQRYFPVLRAPTSQVSGAVQELQQQGAGTPTDLLPFFIAIRNGDAEFLDLVRQGNEHVLGARFADANFFVREDVKFPLEHYREGLKKLVFQTRLGSMFEKSERIVRLAEKIGLLLGLDEAQRAIVYRAAFLAKADLTTQMVTEMTSLQGIIGREYALRGGEPVEVAEAIGEQYQPVPRTLPGVVVALADRIDSLVGLFAAGLAPSGTKDPFGLRRAAIGTVEPLIQHQLDFDLRQAVEAAAALQPIAVSEEVKAQVLEFLTGRMRVLLIEAGFRYDVVDAVLAAQSHNPAACASAARALTEWVNRADWMPILEGYARCARIVRSAPDALKNLQSPVERERLVEEAERKLYDALQVVVSRPPSSVHAFLGAIQALLPFITEFFDKVLVMDPDEAIRRNRLMLVARIRDLAQGIADLSKLEGF